MGHSRNEDVYFMGPDRKSIHCNVYHSVIISPPNRRTIIQSFRPALPEALSQVFLNSNVSNVAMIERRVHECHCIHKINSVRQQLLN